MFGWPMQHKTAPDKEKECHAAIKADGGAMAHVTFKPGGM
jgi:hypothetical protein